MVYATRRAADRLPRGWRGGRVVTITRVFSEETSRSLLAFLIGKKLRRARGSSGRRPRPSRLQQSSRRPSN